MKGQRFIIGILAFALLALAPQTLLAQSDSTTGQLFGTVTDPDGGIMSGATIDPAIGKLVVEASPGARCRMRAVSIDSP